MTRQEAQAEAGALRQRAEACYESGHFGAEAEAVTFLCCATVLEREHSLPAQTSRLAPELPFRVPTWAAAGTAAEVWAAWLRCGDGVHVGGNKTAEAEFLPGLTGDHGGPRGARRPKSRVSAD